MSKKNKTVYLFGAGAAIPWKAPTTTDLTELVLNSGFYCKKNDKRVTQFLFEKLQDCFPKDEINFETILNVIEELTVIHSTRDYKNSNSVLFPFLESKKIMDSIFNFSIPGEWKHGSSIVIQGHEIENGRHAFSNQSPNQFYLQLLYANILTDISCRVSKYSYHSEAVTRIETEEKLGLNDCFHNWISTEINNNSIVRLYTLNYDRLFSVILKKRGVTIFEGGDCKAEINPNEALFFDIPRISTDFYSNVHYNLHGSSFWNVLSKNKNSLPQTQFYLTGAPNLSSNLWEQPLQQVEKGKTINPSNIITGY